MMRLQLIYKPKLLCNQSHVSHQYLAPQQILVPTHLSTHCCCSFCSCNAFRLQYTPLWPNIRLFQCKIRYVINERDVALVGQLYVQWPKVNETLCSSDSLFSAPDHAFSPNTLQVWETRDTDLANWWQNCKTTPVTGTWVRGFSGPLSRDFHYRLFLIFFWKLLGNKP